MSEDRRLSFAPLVCAPMHRALATLLAVAAFLAVPGAALAQSAGDEQYVDPFQGGDEQPAPAPQEEPQAAPAAPEPAAPAPAAPPADTGEDGQVVAEPAQTDAPTLPRTGLPVVLVFSAGYALLLAGVALRRRL
jgi:hypothetical protein